MCSSEDTLVIAEADPELKSLNDVFVETKTLFDTLKNELVANLSLDTLSEMMKVNRSMTKILLLIQVKTKKSIKNHEEEIADLQSKIASKSVPKKVVEKSKLFVDKTTKETNGRLSYYFQRDGSHHENTNLDYVAISNSHHFLSCWSPTKPWRSSDAVNLLDGVFHSLKLEKLEELSRILRSRQKMSEEKLHSLEQELNLLKDSLVEGFSKSNFLSKEADDRDYNWQWISKKYLNNRFTPEECKRVWHLVAKPSISTDGWTAEEDLLLRQIAMENAFQNWPAVNDQLPKRRSDFICFVHYQNVFKEKRNSMKICALKENAGFDFISTFVPCQNESKHRVIRRFRYRQTMHQKRLGLFSNRERFLVNSFVTRGYSYNAIARFVGSRTPRQVKEYHLAQKKKRTQGPWSRNEIRCLLKAVKYLGEQNWTRISKSVAGRSPTQCQQKFSKLKLQNREMVKNYCKRNMPIKIKLAGIKKFLKNDRQVKTDDCKTRKSVDSKIESYFVQVLHEKTKSRGTNDEILFSESVFSLLKYLNFSVPQENEFPKEIFTWLTRDLTSNTSALPFDDIFRETFAPLKNEFKCCRSFFSNVLDKSIRVLPPSRCTINGFNAFFKNYESFAGSNENLNFSEMWKKIDSHVGRRRDFLEAKIHWYRILKAMFYWPVKLKSISPEELLKK